MNKEEILEKIMGRLISKNMGITDCNQISPEKLAFYLSELEKRIEEQGDVISYLCNLMRDHKHPTPSIDKGENKACNGTMTKCDKCGFVYCNGCWSKCPECEPDKTEQYAKDDEGNIIMPDIKEPVKVFKAWDRKHIARMSGNSY